MGYLLKNTAPDRIVSAIREAVGGGASMSPEIARRVVALFQRVGAATDAPGAARESLAFVRDGKELRVLDLAARSDKLTATAAGQPNLCLCSLDELSPEPAVARQLTSTAGTKADAQFTSDRPEGV